MKWPAVQITRQRYRELAFPLSYSVYVSYFWRTICSFTLFTLTACVFKAVDRIWEEANTAEEPSSLLLVNLLVIPNTDSDWVRFPNVSEKGETQLTFKNLHKLPRPWPRLSSIRITSIRWCYTCWWYQHRLCCFDSETCLLSIFS